MTQIQSLPSVSLFRDDTAESEGFIIFGKLFNSLSLLICKKHNGPWAGRGRLNKESNRNVKLKSIVI